MKKKLFALGGGELKTNTDGFFMTSCRHSMVDIIIYVLPHPLVVCSATSYSDVKRVRSFGRCVSL